MNSLTLHLKEILVGTLQPKCKDTVTLTRLWIPAISREDGISRTWQMSFLNHGCRYSEHFITFYILGLFSIKYCGYKLPSEKIATWIMLCKQMLSRSVFDFNFTRQVLQKRWCLQTTKTRLLLSWHYSPKTACSLNIVDLKLDNNPHETKLLK